MSEQTVPISRQVDRILRKKIYNRHYINGHLPSESQLASELGVSRATIRTILVKFEAEGLITRKHGQGTFINTHVLDVNSRSNGIWDFRCMIEDGGRIPTVNKISVEKRFPTQAEIDILDIAQDVQIISLLRLYLADGQPVVYSNNHIPFCFFCGNDIDEIDTSLPVHQLVRRYFNQEISYSVSDIRAEIMPAFLREYLLLEAGSSLIRLEDTYYNISNQAIMCGVNYYCDKVMPLRIARSWA